MEENKTPNVPTSLWSKIQKLIREVLVIIFSVTVSISIAKI